MLNQCYKNTSGCDTCEFCQCWKICTDWNVSRRISGTCTEWNVSRRISGTYFNFYHHSRILYHKKCYLQCSDTDFLFSKTKVHLIRLKAIMNKAFLNFANIVSVHRSDMLFLFLYQELKVWKKVDNERLRADLQVTFWASCISLI